MKKLAKLFLIPVSLMLISTLTGCNTTPPDNPDTPVEPGGDEDEEASITGIHVVTNPNRMTYQPGEYIDLTGLKVAIDYSDGTYDITTHQAVTVPNIPLVAGQTTVEITFRGQYKTNIEGLVVKKSSIFKLEAEASYAYWSKPNNRKDDKQFLIANEDGNNASGSYMGALGKECFSVTWHFTSDTSDLAKFHFSSDFRTTQFIDNNPESLSELPMSQVYEFHVNGQKVDLSNVKLYHRDWLSFTTVELGSANIKAGLNTVSLTHILRNGENGNVDYIGVESGATITPVTPNKTKIEAETFATSGDDIGAEGNNASGGQAVKNRGIHQSGWASTAYTSTEAKTVSLLINWGLNQEFNMSEWNIYVNDVKVNNVSTLIPYHFWAGINWVDWNELYICDLQLEKGTNIIKIEKPDSNTHGTNMDYIVLLG